MDINQNRSLLGPKISNQVRDLAIQHWVALGRLIGFIKCIKLKGMILWKTFYLRTLCLIDSDFAKDPVARKSIGGEFHTLGGCLTAFSSKGDKSISKSTAEAEYKS